MAWLEIAALVAAASLASCASTPSLPGVPPLKGAAKQAALNEIAGSYDGKLTPANRLGNDALNCRIVVGRKSLLFVEGMGRMELELAGGHVFDSNVARSPGNNVRSFLVFLGSAKVGEDDATFQLRLDWYESVQKGSSRPIDAGLSFDGDDGLGSWIGAVSYPLDFGKRRSGPGMSAQYVWLPEVGSPPRDQSGWEQRIAKLQRELTMRLRVDQASQLRRQLGDGDVLELGTTRKDMRYIAICSLDDGSRLALRFDGVNVRYEERLSGNGVTVVQVTPRGDRATVFDLIAHARVAAPGLESQARDETLAHCTVLEYHVQPGSPGPIATSPRPGAHSFANAAILAAGILGTVALFDLYLDGSTPTVASPTAPRSQTLDTQPCQTCGKLPLLLLPDDQRCRCARW